MNAKWASPLMGIGMVVLLTAAVRAGDWYGVFIGSGGLPGLNPRFAFDYTNNNDTLNCVYVAQIVTDGKVKSVHTVGGPHDDWRMVFGYTGDSQIGICDSAGTFFNGLVMELDSLGSGFGFSFEMDPTTPGLPGSHDEFSFSILARGDLYPFETADPLGSNALFALTLQDDSSQDLTVFEPMRFVFPDSLILDSLSVVGVQDGPPVHERLRFLAVGPNPFHSQVDIQYAVPAPGARIAAYIYDPQGRLVRDFGTAEQPPGDARFTWDGKDSVGRLVASGIYFIELRAGGQAVFRRVVLVR